MDPSQLEEPDEALRQQLLSTIPHFEDIYISNENITALPQGRKPDTLRRLATESHQDTLHRKDDGEARFRQALETMDTMEDPLDVYLKHIAWIDQVYLQGNQHQSPLNDTLKMAVHRFEDEEKYKHDLRFLRCWLRLASLQEDPQKIYLYLIHKKIGQTSALFYVEYCKYYAKRKKYTEAGKVLESGINNSAVPMKMLEKARAALEAEIEQSQPSPSSTELHQERMRDLAKHGRSILGVIYDASKPTGRGVGVSGSNRLSGLGAGGLGRLNPPRTPLGLGSRKRTLTPHTSMPVFNDTDRTPEPTLPPPQTTLNLTPPKTTENKIASEPMQGAILKSRPCKKPKKDTFVVYRDTVSPILSREERERIGKINTADGWKQ
ncbi:Mad3/BUB1 homology region 1-domain-containing protein [Spinellus fusiger]|nr:Mad3/BUB1 homology region 1-domain-containing protein [Spinellus fusiger]